MKKKRFITCLVLSIVMTTCIYAQKQRNYYINFSYGIEHLENQKGDFLNLKSDYTVGFTIGHTYLLHRTPIARMLSFGLDWTYLDLKISDYSTDFQNKYAVGEAHLFNVDVAMHIGPSIRLKLTPKISVNAYFRFAPTFTDFFNGKFGKYDYRYSNTYVTGLNIVYSSISVGFDYRFSVTDHHFKVMDDYAFETEIESTIHKSIPMIYLSLRF